MDDNTYGIRIGAPFLVTKPLTVDKETGIPNSLAVGESLILAILSFANTTETHNVPSFISVNASPKFKTPTSISPLIKFVLIGATPL